MNYKKIIRSRKVRFAILNALSFLPDSIMLPIQYKLKLGRWPNFRTPTRWTEKLQVYKMKYRNPILGQCVDKYEVRSYVQKKGLGDILVQLYGVYDGFSDIDFNSLPQSFVLKTNNGGGGLNVCIVRDKALLDVPGLENEFNEWLSEFKVGNRSFGREWAYEKISKARILAEELLVNQRNPEAGVEDYKILCFGGKPHYVIVDVDRYIDHRRNIYDCDWKRVMITTDHEGFDYDFPRPENFEKMLEIAGRLAEDFPFVRVDLYNVAGKIYFGELTFYPWTGYVQFDPDEFDKTLGDLFDMSTFC